MFAKLVRTNNDWVLLVARLVLGVLFALHGSQKIFAWPPPGHTFNETMAAFTEKMGIPAPLAFLAIAAEFGGGIGLILGFLGRIDALGIICVMAVAIAKVHYANGLFMNWTGKQPGEGYEYHLLAIAVALVILVKGSGALSIDRLLSNAPPPA